MSGNWRAPLLSSPMIGHRRAVRRARAGGRRGDVHSPFRGPQADDHAGHDRASGPDRRLFGHAIGLIAAYVVGVGPAAATGFLYALWDAAAPGALAARARRRADRRAGRVRPGVAPRAPRRFGRDDGRRPVPACRAAEWIDAASPERIGVTLAHAFVACGAIAGLVCGLAANLLGLTMRPEYASPEDALPRARTPEMADASRPAPSRLSRAAHDQDCGAVCCARPGGWLGDIHSPLSGPQAQRSRLTLSRFWS